VPHAFAGQGCRDHWCCQRNRQRDRDHTPEKSLSFLFCCAAVFVLLVIMIYTAAVYWVFCGKLRHA
jgi:hypothetical protein